MALTFNFCQFSKFASHAPAVVNQKANPYVHHLSPMYTSNSSYEATPRRCEAALARTYGPSRETCNEKLDYGDNIC